MKLHAPVCPKLLTRGHPRTNKHILKDFRNPEAISTPQGGHIGWQVAYRQTCLGHFPGPQGTPTRPYPKRRHKPGPTTPPRQGGTIVNAVDVRLPPPGPHIDAARCWWRCLGQLSQFWVFSKNSSFFIDGYSTR